MRVVIPYVQCHHAFVLEEREIFSNTTEPEALESIRMDGRDACSKISHGSLGKLFHQQFIAYWFHSRGHDIRHKRSVHLTRQGLVVE